MRLLFFNPLNNVAINVFDWRDRVHQMIVGAKVGEI